MQLIIESLAEFAKKSDQTLERTGPSFITSVRPFRNIHVIVECFCSRPLGTETELETPLAFPS